MELKPYQQEVLNDLDRYLQYIEREGDFERAFNSMWEERLGPYNPFEGKGMEPYRNDLPGVPHVCIKVPTAGGKTFIASNAIEVIYRHYPQDFPRAVIWLVPSITILDQTIKNLSDPAHPYRQRINTHFSSRVEIFGKDGVMNGAGFNATSVKEQLNIIVLSFDTLRAKNKEDRKFFQENGNLVSFPGAIADDALLEGTPETALINVIRNLRPVVIVDEAHGATSPLSVEMLKNLNPSFVLDLTATPRKTSNIISFVNAIALKKEHMVKLPVIVYNNRDRSGVIESAINLQRKLENDARQEESAGGKYIRPIVLFQAQPKTSAGNLTFEKIKRDLVSLGIPETQVKIKTADINEIRDIDLLSRDCEVRYIITVNALKEGWDCPFAYILASLADKSSAVDVEQILGRVLRQPYVQPHKHGLLNCSFVLTASGKFVDTLDNIVQGLNKAGFSKHDYKVAVPETVPGDAGPPGVQLSVLEEDEPVEDELITRSITLNEVSAESASVLETIEQEASSANNEMMAAMNDENSFFAELPSEIRAKVNTYAMKDQFAEKAKQIRLPMFFFKVPSGGFFLDEDHYEPLSKDELLHGFRLSQCDTTIDFETHDANLYKVDLEKTRGNDSTPAFSQLPDKDKEPLVNYLLSQPKENQVKQLAGKFAALVGDHRPIADKELKLYLNRIMENMSAEQIAHAVYHELSYRDKIKQKIKLLSDQYAEKEFDRRLDSDQVFTKETFSLLPAIQPGKTGAAITKSLYESEADMNSFEEEVINAIANCPNVEFWHRNMDDRGFRINGFITHFPDFIVQMRSGKILLIETKGDHLDGENSKARIRLGQKWAGKAGNAYRYYMVFDQKKVDGALTLEEMLTKIKDL